MRSTYIFGDSIMKGVMFDSASGRYSMNPKLSDELRESCGADIINKSNFGCTVTKGEARIEATLARGVAAECAIIEYGGNDSDFKWAEIAESPDTEHLPNTPLESFKQTYREIIGKIKAAGITPVVMTLPPIDAERYFARIVSLGSQGDKILKWLGDVQMIYRFQEMYSAAAASVASGMGVLVADVRSCFLDKHNYRSLMCDDGIHPNEAGQALICEAVGASLRAMA